MKIEPLNATSIQAIVQCDGGNGWRNDAAGWAQIAQAQENDERHVLVAVKDGAACGYGSLLWRSAYPAFAADGIPEIHDLATAATYRRQGIATRLIAALETIAAEKGCRQVGLSVGLYADYGPAQRLYVSLGYRPDGRGATYKNRAVTPGSEVPMDDDLHLWLTKQLDPSSTKVP